MLSIPHLIIVFIVALVVFGPEKLPELARNLGKIMGEFKRATGDLRSTFEGHLRDLEREADQRRMRNEVAVRRNRQPLSRSAPGTLCRPRRRPAASLPLRRTSWDRRSAPPDAPAVCFRDCISPDERSSENARSAPQSAAPAAARRPLEPEHNPETLTDAGIHPA